KQVETLFPEKMGDELKEAKDFDENTAISTYQRSTSVKSPKTGYLQYIDSDVLLEQVATNDSLFRLLYRPGGFVVKGGEIGVLYSNKDWNGESIDKLLNQFVIGKTKTSQQDLEFSIHQMVE